MKKLLVFILICIPLLAPAQKSYFIGFGQVTLPTGDFARASENTDAYAAIGYGGGADLNIHLNESLLWLTTLSFSANKMEGFSFRGDPFILSDTYFFYNLPALTGLAFEFPVSEIKIAAWVQGGLNYAEFPNVSGFRISESSILEKIDTSLDAQAKWGVSAGTRATFHKMSLGVRYFHFGDYEFSGTFFSSKTALTRDIKFKSSISFLMLHLGYQLDFLEK